MKSPLPLIRSLFLLLVTIIAYVPEVTAEEAAKSNSIEELKKEAAEGNPSSQFWLGVCYTEGKAGVEKDYDEAYKWFSKAYEGGSTSAGYSLGLCYKNGQGVTQDYAKAVNIFRKLAEKGESSSQYEMGDCYFKGLGVPQDTKQAVEFWRKSADEGDYKAQIKLGMCYFTGKGVPKDLVLAYMWMDIASHDGLIKIAEKQRELIAANMTSDQVAEAKKLCKEWKINNK
jgi:TPR repeat protein